MHAVSRALIQHARGLADEVRAVSIVICADVLAESKELAQFIESCAIKVILVTRDSHPNQSGPAGCTCVSVPDVHLTRTGQIKVAMLVALASGTLHSGDRVVCLTGIDRSDVLDTIVVLNLGAEPELF